MKRILALFLLLLLAGCQIMDTNAPTTSAAAASVSPASEPTAEPIAAQSAAPAAYAFTFTAKTLDGAEVQETFFGQYDLTMVNVWASWCPPCRGELSELGELYTRLPENVGFLSITVDDPGDLKTAKSLLEQNGCTFPCLDGQGSEGLMKNLLGRVTAIPTTVFFDRAGNEVGDWIVGVPQGKGSVADAYLSEIQTRLDLLNGK